MRFLVLAGLFVLANAQAQHHGYAGGESRDIKALSGEEVEQYLAGAGMGYAKAAELNHFPGPMHVLELAERLGLSAEQRSATKRLMDAHKAEARAIGAKLVDAVRRTAALQGEYRLSHLETRRRMRALPTEQQVKRYDALRRPSKHP